MSITEVRVEAIQPFRIAVPDAVLGDLAARLERARVPSPPILDGGETVETIRRIEQLVAHWRAGYDWRAQERRLNAFPHYRATVDGAGIHFILAYGLNDSPLGLAAWILEKFLTWSDPATRWRLSADDLLTTVMLCWATETIGSSVRLYALRSAPLGSDELVTAPTSVLAPHEPKLPVPPESWLRRAYPNLARFVALNEGGHFLALESPARFAAEVRDAFRPYRTSRS